MKTIKHLLLFTLLGVLFVACEAEDVLFEETESVMNLELNSPQIEETTILPADVLQERSEDEDEVPPPNGRDSEDEDEVPPPNGKDSEDEDEIPLPNGKDSEDEDEIPTPNGNK